jgi:diaminopimelate decarboxylase
MGSLDKVALCGRVKDALDSALIMDHFSYREGNLYCEDVLLSDLAERVGTPVYVYSKRTLEAHYDGLARAFAPLRPKILYSVKSSGNLHLLSTLVARGSGMDVVSGGELFRSLKAGAPPETIVFAGVGKTDRELRQAIHAGIGFINVESEEEIAQLERSAREEGAVPNVAVRINPDVIDSRTHRHTATGHKGSKFGIGMEHVEAVFEQYGRSPHLALRGLHFHLGSPIYSAEPYVRAIQRVLELMRRLEDKGFRVDALDIGGGFMADYGQAGAAAPNPDEYAGPIIELLQGFVDRGGTVLIEPGRTISANAGLLLTSVLYTKHSGERRIAVVDTGMHHLLRPALYEAVMFMWPAKVAPEHVPRSRDVGAELPGVEAYDVVGPICESTDKLASQRKLPPLSRGDLLGIFSAGAYGMVMASQYNAVPRPPEVLVDGQKATVIRRRETHEDLIEAELELSEIY